MQYVVVDRRGYDDPDVIGPFDTWMEAVRYAEFFHGGGGFEDSVFVVPLQKPNV